ncbi:MAG: RimJ/RimL family protein N-acetyltransferase [Sulfobacillus benefaciens]|uniref:RimJ/RimL family protein N-acetyltransferase n=1 Tax=Sulfobacillus benefaciens TaxID=453960 RepID=A0A2T2WVN6_9FIRM|nr:MAG: RimJ/RimL family protein N-acetyltransferase [Sulfobacillus benefaciens]
MFRHAVTQDIFLRILEIRDAYPLLALINISRQQLREWLPWVDGTSTVQDTENFIRAGLNQFASNNGSQLGIWYRGELAGVLGMHDLNWSDRFTSLGYWLGTPFQGRGIMTQSCRALITILFEEYDLNRVEIQVAADNRKSQAIAERLGFQKEGHRRQAEWLYDHFVDHIVYGLLYNDWKAARNS